MDLNKLYQYLINKKYTDIELILVDNNKQIIINAHKIILAYFSDYFNKMFDFGQEKNQSQITINVNNCDIARDIILSFYGQKNSSNYSLTDWKYLLELFKSRSFFCLPNDISLLYDLKVLEEDFELLLEIAEEFDYINDIKLLKTIKKNIPHDYDLDNFSLDFIKEMLKNKNYFIVSGNEDRSIKIWDAETGDLLNILDGHYPTDADQVNGINEGHDPMDTNRLNIENKGHTDWVWSVAISSDNLKIVSGSSDQSIKIWDAVTGNLLKTLNKQIICVDSVAFSPDNLKIVSKGDNGNIKIWDAVTGILLNTIHAYINHCVTYVAFSPDNSKIVSGSDRGSIKIWNTNTGNLLNKLNEQTGLIHCVAFSHDNLKIVSGSIDKYIKIWDAISGNLLNTLNGHRNAVNSVVFSSDNLKIVSGSEDGNIKIWDAVLGILLKTLEGHTSCVNSVAFSPDNLKIISGSFDGSIKIWNAQSGILLNTLLDNNNDDDHGYVLSVAISHPISDDTDKKLINYLNKQSAQINYINS